jgi:hypothetical protein
VRLDAVSYFSRVRILPIVPFPTSFLSEMLMRYYSNYCGWELVCKTPRPRPGHHRFRVLHRRRNPPHPRNTLDSPHRLRLGNARRRLRTPIPPNHRQPVHYIATTAEQENITSKGIYTAVQRASIRAINSEFLVPLPRRLPPIHFHRRIRTPRRHERESRKLPRRHRKRRVVRAPPPFPK